MQLHQAYQARVELHNPHDAPVDLKIKSSASQRYQIRPEKVHIEPQSSTTVIVRLKVMHFPNKRKAKAGQRDYFHMTSRYFEQKFFTTFYLLGTPEKEQKLPKEFLNQRSRQETTRNPSAISKIQKQGQVFEHIFKVEKSTVLQQTRIYTLHHFTHHMHPMHLLVPEICRWM